MSALVSKIVSGGQTGTDRAALDWAMKVGIPHGGWCPKGRKAEAGPIDARYQLQETPSSDYVQRTEWNVRDSDGTVIFTIMAQLTGGSKKTAEFARQHAKPCLHLSAQTNADPATELRTFIQTKEIKVLNIAGSRAAKEPGVGAFVAQVLSRSQLA